MILKLPLFVLAILPFSCYCSVYHEVKALPDLCYASSGYVPDSVTIIPKCSALADYQAKRPMKTEDEYFKSIAPSCESLNESSGDKKIYCQSAYMTYKGVYGLIPGISSMKAPGLTTEDFIAMSLFGN